MFIWIESINKDKMFFKDTILRTNLSLWSLRNYKEQFLLLFIIFFQLFDL